ncbi:DNA helicase MCM8 [Oryzias melastigma]|uniref:DNA helicase MCM8 n=1 Tax=Oryzias melastigma TaxID=30732 RepID=A0A834FJE1_ORYME|nr:DNA helicase MCM8 [Oryzias melastigma]
MIPGEVHPGVEVEAEDGEEGVVDGEAAEVAGEEEEEEEEELVVDGEEEAGRTDHGEEDPQGVEEALEALGEGVLVAEDHQVRHIVLRESLFRPLWMPYVRTKAGRSTSLKDSSRAPPVWKRSKCLRNISPPGFTFLTNSLCVQDEIERQGSVLVDYADLTGDRSVSQALPDVVTALKEQPEVMLSCLGLAIHQVLTTDLEKQAAELQEEELPVSAPIINIPHISARLYNYEPLTPLRTLRASVFGRLVCVKGTVVRVSNIRPLCTRMAFRCQTCSSTMSLPLQHGKYATPTKCIQPGCRSRTFTPLRSSALTLTVDWQIIKVQEMMSGEQRETGRIPRTVECHLTSDLCDSCVPGDTVIVTGIVRVNNDGSGSSRGNKDQCMFLLYIDATSVSNTKGQLSKSAAEESSGSLEGRSGGEEFSLKELYAVQEIQSQPDLLRLIVHSLCPAIYGHLLVKAALALALFGGRQKLTGKNSVPVRGDPHILIVGDPGLGKSQMLQAVCNVAPRGIYVCGNSTSTTGNLSRDAGSGDYALEAGALVLADQGLCCIDEFDKLGSQQQALLEAMEQQSVSLAKAGIVSSLPARTSVVAAANPVGGHYNRGKTVSENLKMGSALLSRFDVVFLLLDIPDESHDRCLSEHVMANRTGKGRTSGAVVTRSNGESETSILLQHSDMPLSERLQVPEGQSLDLIPASLLRKYISYARQYVHPTLSPEAAQTLQDFYLSLRSQASSADSTPITTRQLESLIRLTEARAKLELRETATKSDAEDVVEIMKHSLADTYSDGLGNLDFERSQLGSGMSQRSAAKRLVNALHSHAQRTSQKQFDLQTLRSMADKLNIKVADFQGLLSSLNEQGFLLKKGPKLYQLQTI